jgi:uncharacterized protein (TIGR03085 family)
VVADSAGPLSRNVIGMGVARAEREELCDLFEKVGPDAPTLCEGWQTKDLAVHLVLRDRRPDAAAGMVARPLAAHAKRVHDGYAAKSWSELVELVRTGPPRWSPLGVGRLDEMVNSAEFFVHHEDVRRALPGWEPRPADPVRDAALWRALRFVVRITYRRSEFGVLLRRPDGEVLLAKRGPKTVTISGEPGELLLYAFGRDPVRIDFAGDEESIAAVRGLSRKV